MWKLTRVHEAVEKVSNLLKRDFCMVHLSLEDALNKICGADIVSDTTINPDNSRRGISGQRNCTRSNGVHNAW